MGRIRGRRGAPYFEQQMVVKALGRNRLIPQPFHSERMGHPSFSPHGRGPLWTQPAPSFRQNVEDAFRRAAVAVGADGGADGGLRQQRGAVAHDVG